MCTQARELFFNKGKSVWSWGPVGGFPAMFLLSLIQIKVVLVKICEVLGKKSGAKVSKEIVFNSCSLSVKGLEHCLKTVACVNTANHHCNVFNTTMQIHMTSLLCLFVDWNFPISGDSFCFFLLFFPLFDCFSSLWTCAESSAVQGQTVYARVKVQINSIYSALYPLLHLTIAKELLVHSFHSLNRPHLKSNGKFKGICTCTHGGKQAYSGTII